MQRDLRAPMIVWAATSVLLIGVLSRIESAWIVGALYIGLNGLSMVLALVRQPPMPDAPLRALGWCTAAQLPTMLVLLFDIDGNRSPRKRARADAESVADTGRTQRPAGSRQETGFESGTVNSRLPSRRMTADRSQRPEPRQTEPDPG